MKKIEDYSLYLIISEECGKGRNVADIARAAIAGGVDIIQMREKNKKDDKLISLGKELSCLCKEKGVTFIVNDDPFLAKKVNADGVHLGQEDMERFSINETRSIVGRSRVIGVSTHSIKQLEKANGDDVDYIAYGPVFPTKTKDYCIGTKDVARVLVIAKKPVFFIGGIDLSNIEEILRIGARNIALIRGITEAVDIKSATEELVKMINGEGCAHDNKNKR